MEGAGLRIWVTRAQPGADATAARLRLAGHAPLVESLLVVSPLSSPTPPGDDVAALAFTSTNAVTAFAASRAERGWPVFTVGAATAEAARAAGFTDVCSAEGDVAALAALIAARPPGGAVLHPCARETAGDLQGELEALGVRLQTWPIYQTRAVEQMPSRAGEALQGRALSDVLVHSPKAAQALAALLIGRPSGELATVRLLGLSQACLEPLRLLPFASRTAAAAPNEAALFALLE